MGFLPLDTTSSRYVVHLRAHTQIRPRDAYVMVCQAHCDVVEEVLAFDVKNGMAGTVEDHYS